MQRICIVPPIAVVLAKHPAVDSYDLSSLETVASGAAPLDAELGHAVARRLGCRVMQGYGMTELSPVSHCVPDGVDLDVATVGRLLPNMEAMIVDPATGTELPPGERGELWCRGPNVMAGYLNDPDATAATLDDDGWLHTGDLATVDEDGVFTIVDRLKELIKYKGWSVAPAELEAVLLTHDRIADAAVIGVRDADGEEVPKAFVVPQPGADLTAAEVLAFVAERVAPYKKVRAVEFVDAIPKSAVRQDPSQGPPGSRSRVHIGRPRRGHGILSPSLRRSSLRSRIAAVDRSAAWGGRRPSRCSMLAKTTPAATAPQKPPWSPVSRSTIRWPRLCGSREVAVPSYTRYRTRPTAPRRCRTWPLHDAVGPGPVREAGERHAHPSTVGRDRNRFVRSARFSPDGGAPRVL